MAASIIRLEQENQELHAEVALLREEQKILAKAKAAVPEGGTGYSGAEQPEPPPHLSIGGHEMSDTPETDATANPLWGEAQEVCLLRELARMLERERDEARAECERLNRLLRHETALGQGDIDHWAALECERDEARGALTEVERENDQLLASNKNYERDWPILVHERDEARGIMDVIERDWKEKCMEADTMRQHYKNACFEIEKLKQERDEARADADEWQNKYAGVFVERDEAREALKRIAGCDWVITLPDRMDAVRKIARDALEGAK